MSATHEQQFWRPWYNQVTGGDSYRSVAERIDMEHSKLYKQLNGHKPPAETVIAICRAYGTHPVTGLVETGYLDSLESVPAQQLLTEVDERLRLPNQSIED
ncbi:helix-turn-helix domain-containing protein [Nocardia cyriacigeorgica]|uniref:helix-turn-helix domain-containing protein n=1 Tax=Nocardia cyriacigeorgica TaxID=135487 RepID=UPI00189617DA|nr:helix-turn-helix transcriptional regulator [Nocardia cyriacigeorgica]MBF6412889.1 helix-turn-helix domain-containing protein [Nocardia cyriacigeorgica]